jgi:hypothetical protein
VGPRDAVEEPNRLASGRGPLVLGTAPGKRLAADGFEGFLLGYPVTVIGTCLPSSAGSRHRWTSSLKEMRASSSINRTSYARVFASIRTTVPTNVTGASAIPLSIGSGKVRSWRGCQPPSARASLTP